MKKINSEENEEISKKMPLDISEIKEENNKSLFYSNVSEENNNNELKNAYNTNTYNIQKNYSKINSNEIENNFKSKIKQNSKNIESEIKILTYIWKSKLLISGYYEFEILFTKKDVNLDKILIQRTIYRSYHDIEILYQGLILYNPGCLIPKVPTQEQGLGNKENIEELKKMLENYLGYICKHIYLSKNPIFLIFISDEFERYRDKINENNNDNFSIYSLVKLCVNESYKYSKNLISNTLMSSTNANNEISNGNLTIEISDKRLRDEKNRLEKVITGTEKFISSLGEEIASVSQKIESMKNMNKISNILKDSNFRVELNQNNIDDSFLNQKNFFSLESIVYIKMAENYEIYVTKIKEIHKNLIKYKEVTEALTEAFIRKEKVELDYNREKNADFSMGNDQQKIRELTENYRNVEIQFFEELSNYHKNIENMFSVYANNYIDIKNKTDKNNQLILMNKTLKNNTP